jgi:hypothetical protein
VTKGVTIDDLLARWSSAELAEIGARRQAERRREVEASRAAERAERERRALAAELSAPAPQPPVPDDLASRRRAPLEHAGPVPVWGELSARRPRRGILVP